MANNEPNAQDPCPVKPEDFDTDEDYRKARESWASDVVRGMTLLAKQRCEAEYQQKCRREKMRRNAILILSVVGLLPLWLIAVTLVFSFWLQLADGRFVLAFVLGSL